MPQDVHEVETEARPCHPPQGSAPALLVVLQWQLQRGQAVLGQACPLWPFRHGHRPNEEDRAAIADRQLYPLERHLVGAAFHGSALRAIRRRCIDCSAGDAEARSCEFGPDHPAPCSLHPYRLGRNRHINRSDEWKRAAAELTGAGKRRRFANEAHRDPHSIGDQGLRGLGPGK